jgi:hypothetical protein
MMNKQLAIALVGLLCGLLVVGGALAQGTATINWWVIAGGGAPSGGGQVTLNDTLGQPIIGPSSSGNVWLGAGYWGGARPTNARLTVNKVGGGTGAVASDPSGIFCGADCAEVYDIENSHNFVVTLTAYPGVKSYLASWSGDCSGTGRSIQVMMDGDKTCIATFGYPIGGIVVPVDKLGLLGPWMGPAVLMGLLVAGTAVALRRRTSERSRVGQENRVSPQNQEGGGGK